MQKCGQLQASIAVALIAQSAGGAVWPTVTPSRAAMMVTNTALRIRLTPLWGGNYIPPLVPSQVLGPPRPWPNPSGPLPLLRNRQEAVAHTIRLLIGADDRAVVVDL